LASASAAACTGPSAARSDTLQTLALPFVGVAASALLSVHLGMALGFDYLARPLIDLRAGDTPQCVHAGSPVA
jgi:hypothetical protein